VGNSLLPLSTAAAGTGHSRDVLIEEKVVETNLFSLQLHQQRAFPLAKSFMEL
jgi:hypothetical protein